MSSTALNNLVRVGSLTEEAAEQIEFDRLVELGQKKLLDAHNVDLSAESRFDLAYNAAHALSLAALRWHGFRSDKRYVVFQALAHTLNLDAKICRMLASAHDARNVTEYEGGFGSNERLLSGLIESAEMVAAEVKKLRPVPSSGRKKPSVR